MRQAEQTAMQNMAPVLGSTPIETQKRYRRAVQALLGLLTGEEAEVVIMGMKFEVHTEQRPLEDPTTMMDIDSGKRTITIGYLDADQARQSLQTHMEQGGF